MQRTITFEDKGQDFLEWDLDANGLIMDSRPCKQSWVGNTVVWDTIDLGFKPQIIMDSPHARYPISIYLNYAIIKMEVLGDTLPAD